MTTTSSIPQRGAWIEINNSQLRRNIQLIRKDIPADIKYLVVIKDDAYGHGLVNTAHIAQHENVWGFGVATLEEAITLRQSGITKPILLFYERQDSELPACLEHNITICTGRASIAQALSRQAALGGLTEVPIHVEVNTGMNRYGARWDAAADVVDLIAQLPCLRLQGLMQHFAKSYASDKDFANLQHDRFQKVIKAMSERHIGCDIIHACNSGGYLNLPQARHDMIRSGILHCGLTPFGCRKIAGIAPVMSVKARIADIQKIKVGDVVGYGMNFTARRPSRIAVLPFGYGDGYPRACNQGHVLIHKHQAPIVGGNAMDATMVDVTDIPQAEIGDECVVLGKQGMHEITARDIALLRQSVTYDVLTSMSIRMRRHYID